MGALSVESRAATWRFAGVILVAFLMTTAAGSAAMGGVSVAASRRLCRAAGWIVLITWPLALILALTGWIALAMAGVSVPLRCGWATAC